MRRILVTHALPYANGPLHLGHTIEAVQTDVWVRFQRLRGHDCLLVCAEDSHGTPIMIRAQQQGQSPEQLIAAMASEHQRDYRELLVQHDQFAERGLVATPRALDQRADERILGVGPHGVHRPLGPVLRVVRFQAPVAPRRAIP